MVNHRPLRSFRVTFSHSFVNLPMIGQSDILMTGKAHQFTMKFKEPLKHGFADCLQYGVSRHLRQEIVKANIGSHEPGGFPHLRTHLFEHTS